MLSNFKSLYYQDSEFLFPGNSVVKNIVSSGGACMIYRQRVIALDISFELVLAVSILWNKSKNSNKNDDVYA